MELQEERPWSAADLVEWSEAAETVIRTIRCYGTFDVIGLLEGSWSDERIRTAEDCFFDLGLDREIRAKIEADRQALRRPRRRLPSAVRGAVWEKTDGRCWYCGVQTVEGSTFTVDHVLPLTKGGSDDLSNLVPCCRSCNCHKSDR